MRRPQKLWDPWHHIAFSAGCGCSVVLLASWIFEPTRSKWLALDDWFFLAVNSSLSAYRSLQAFWAAANNRAVDIISALTFVRICACFVCRRKRERLQLFVARGLLLTLVVVAAKQINEALAMLVGRESPTLVHPTAVRLSELVPEIPTQDVGHDVFPSGHTTILLLCATVLTCFLPRRLAAVAWFAATVLSVPRLIGGGRWLAAVIVGSVAVAIFVFTYVFATPIHRVVTDRLDRWCSRITQAIPIF